MSLLLHQRVSPGLNKSKHSQMFIKSSIFTPPLTSSFLYLPSPQGLWMFMLQLLVISWKGHSIILRQRATLPRALTLHYWETQSNGGFQCWLSCEVWIEFGNKYQEIVKTEFLHLRQSHTGFRHTHVHVILLTFITMNDQLSTGRAQGWLIRGKNWCRVHILTRR